MAEIKIATTTSSSTEPLINIEATSTATSSVDDNLIISEDINESVNYIKKLK